MYSATYLYELILDQMKDSINFEAYDLSNIDDLGDEMLMLEEDLKEDILCNHDFNWYTEDCRKKLCEAVMRYEGATFSNLSDALENEDKAAELIFKLIFDEVCDDLFEDYVTELKEAN